MALRRTLAVTLTVGLVVAPVAPSAAAAQDTGVLGGKATDKAREPYSDYTVRLRNAEAPGILKTVPLDSQGLFTFGELALPQRYLVELFRVRDSKVICTEGPFPLNQVVTSKTDINIDCGRNPTAWLIAAGAGAALLAAATQSSNQ